MRSYWLRILMGAFAIFAIGMLGVALVRRGKSRVESVIASSEPLSIPLPFVPFQLNGSKLGTIERLTINREAPKKVSSIELQVKMDDSLVAKGLAGCRLAANIENDSSKSGKSGRHRDVDVNVHLNRLDERTFFFCTKSDSGFEELGSATLVPGDVELPLLVPESLAEQLRSGEWGNDADSTDALEERADSIAEAAEAIADSATTKAAKAQARSEVHTRLGDSLRAEGLRRADSIVHATKQMADSLQAH
jgi:hypothetical protein